MEEEKKKTLGEVPWSQMWHDFYQPKFPWKTIDKMPDAVLIILWQNLKSKTQLTENRNDSKTKQCKWRLGFMSGGNGAQVEFSWIEGLWGSWPHNKY